MGGTTDPDTSTPTALPLNLNQYLMSAYYVAGITLGDQDIAPALTQLSQWGRQKTSCLTSAQHAESWERGKLHVCGSSVCTVKNGQGETT